MGASVTLGGAAAFLALVTIGVPLPRGPVFGGASISIVIGLWKCSLAVVVGRTADGENWEN